MWNVCAVSINDPDVKGHVPIVTLHEVITFKDHVSSYSEWTLVSHMKLTPPKICSPRFEPRPLTPQTLKCAWHENFEKLFLLKLVDKVSFHLNISSTIKTLQTCISFRSNRRKLCLCYLLFYLVWWPHFLISKQHVRWFLLKCLEYSHQISPQKSKKYD